ncbi:hypothetical protein BS78_05G184100 [Paspalum vaginatum]|nr:hypothetical protein BS78_05G184100 [Paspalum vaginatum]
MLAEGSSNTLTTSSRGTAIDTAGGRLITPAARGCVFSSATPLLVFFLPIPRQRASQPQATSRGAPASSPRASRRAQPLLPPCPLCGRQSSTRAGFGEYGLHRSTWSGGGSDLQGGGLGEEDLLHRLELEGRISSARRFGTASLL